MEKRIRNLVNFRKVLRNQTDPDQVGDQLGTDCERIGQSISTNRTDCERINQLITINRTDFERTKM